MTPEEQEEYEQSMRDALYCDACGALEEWDCYCDEDDEENYFPYVDKEPEEDDY